MLVVKIRLCITPPHRLTTTAAHSQQPVNKLIVCCLPRDAWMCQKRNKTHAYGQRRLAASCRVPAELSASLSKAPHKLWFITNQFGFLVCIVSFSYDVSWNLGSFCLEQQCWPQSKIDFGVWMGLCRSHKINNESLFEKLWCVKWKASNGWDHGLGRG